MNTLELVFNYLKEQGLCPRIDDDGDIAFKYEMLPFYFFNNKDDESFFRLSLIGIYEVTDENRYAVLEAINEINKEYKVLKAVLPNNEVWLSTEIFIDSTPELDDFFPRLIRILVNGRKDFYELMNN